MSTDVITVKSSDGTPIGLWRSGTGPSLLVVHGTAADHSAWDPVAPLLADAFTVYRMDRRGRGASGDAPDYRIEAEVDDIVAAASALPGPVFLYGHSFGGRVSLEAALRLPGLAGLVLYEGGPMNLGFPPGFTMRLVPDEFVDMLEQMIGAGQRDEALTVFMLKAAGVSEDELPVLKASSAWPGRVAAAHTIPRELRAISEYSADAATYAGLTVPILLLGGTESLPERRQVFVAMGEKLPNSRVAWLPGQRHAAHQTAPQLLADVLRDELLGRRVTS